MHFFKEKSNITPGRTLRGAFPLRHRILEDRKLIPPDAGLCLLFRITPDVVFTETGQGYFQNLAIADYRKLGGTREFTLGEVLISSGNACSQPLKVPLQCFWKIPAALCGGFPAKPPSTLAGFLRGILQLAGYVKGSKARPALLWAVRGLTFGASLYMF
jgi:hypothetical protein